MVNYKQGIHSVSKVYGDMMLRIYKASLYFIYILLVMELIARLLIFLFRLDPEPVVPKSIGRFDARLGWSLKPLSVGYSDATGSRIEYRINSQGFRGKEVEYEKPKGVFRIILLGDSRTFGFGCSIDKHFSTLLENYFKNTEIINLGVSGYGVDQELLMLKFEGLKYRPDLVLAYVVHYRNERHIKTEVFGRAKPRFVLSDHKLELINFPVKKESKSFLRNINRCLSKRIKFYYLLNKSLNDIWSKVEADNNILDNTQNTAWHNKSEELFVLGARIIEEMGIIAKDNAAEFVLVTQVDDLEQRVRGKGLRVLSVSNLLSKRIYELPNGLCHINDAGNALLAQEIANFLKVNALVPENYWENNK